MLLKVGELAKHTGLTVRTLHHYDAIDLLKPSGRSESGYRLYSREDVARLHGIQALRHLGLALGDIAGLLDGEGGATAIIDRQLVALDQEIARSAELRGRLSLMRDGLVKGEEPDMKDWLDTLALMATYGKYFTAAELKFIFENWKPIEGEWIPLMAQVQDAMDRKLAIDCVEVQPLVNRWMTLMLVWMDGDFELMERWGHMFRHEPSAHGRNNAPSGPMIDYMMKAIDVRMALMEKYLEPGDLKRMGKVAPADWRALDADVKQLMADKVPVDSAAARAAVNRWMGLIGQLVRGDPQLHARLMTAWASEPLLAAGSSLSPAVRGYLNESRKSA